MCSGRQLSVCHVPMDLCPTIRYYCTPYGLSPYPCLDYRHTVIKAVSPGLSAPYNNSDKAGIFMYPNPDCSTPQVGSTVLIKKLPCRRRHRGRRG